MFERFLHDAGDGGIGAEFGGGQRDHQQAEEHDEAAAERAAVETVADHQRAEQGEDDHVAPAEDLTELLDDEETCEGGAENAELGEHLAVGCAGGDPFVDREDGAGKHDEIGDGREGEQIDEHAPVGTHRAAEHDGDDAAEDEAAGPAGVEDVEPLRLVPVEHGGHDRVDEGLDGAVSKAEDHRAPVEQAVGALAGGRERLTFERGATGVDHAVGGEGEGRIHGIADENEHHGGAVADAVDHQAEKDDRDGEGPHARAEEFLRLDLVQAEVLGPKPRVVHEEGARDEREGGGDQGDEAPPEQAHVRGRG